MQNQLFDFLVGKDIRRSAIASAAEDIIRWNFMTRVFCPRKAREANQNLKPVRALVFRGCQRSPLNSGRAEHPDIALGELRSSRSSISTSRHYGV
jgi:hypothetical protein